MKSQYRKFTDRIAADASRAAAPLVQSFSWLPGPWLWHARPVSFAPAPYGYSLAGSPFLIHNAASGMWLLVLSDPTAFGILIGLDMRQGVARFTGDVSIDSHSVQLRQTWRRIDDDTLQIENERYTGDHWCLWDRSLLTRLKPSN